MGKEGNIVVGRIKFWGSYGYWTENGVETKMGRWTALFLRWLVDLIRRKETGGLDFMKLLGQNWG